jgi:hypothetical protein
MATAQGPAAKADVATGGGKVEARPDERSQNASIR